MASVSGGGKLGAYLQKLAARIDKADTLEVGFFENAQYPNGTKVASVAAFNEYGVPSHSQPPRPYFRTMITDNKANWGGQLANLMRNNQGDAQVSLNKMGEEVIGLLQDSIIELETPELAKSTIKAKSRPSVGKKHGVMGPEKPLVDTGVMLQSVTKRVS